MNECDFNDAFAIWRSDFYTITKSPVSIRPAIGDARINRIKPFLRDRLAIGAQNSADAAHSRKGSRGTSACTSWSRRILWQLDTNVQFF